MSELNKYTTGKRFHGTTIHQRRLARNGVVGFFNYLILFFAATRFITGRIRQGLLFFLVFLGLYLWDWSRSTVSKAVIRINDKGIDFRGWGGMSWDKIESLRVEYASDLTPYSYHFRIFYHDENRGMTEFTLSALDIKPDQFSALLERYAPESVDLQLY